MPYQPILATLGYLFSPNRQQVLLVHRIARPDDFHYGKYNGLGGKLERDEDIVAGFCREVREEAGVDCQELQLAGTISWPGFGKQGEDWFGFLFRVTAWSGTIAQESAEGPLIWVDCVSVMSLPLWQGDRLFLPRLFDFQSPFFHGVMPYHDGAPVDWRVTELDGSGKIL